MTAGPWFRYHHVSWSQAAEVTVLLGGMGQAGTTSEMVNHGGGTETSFSLKYETE